MFKPTDQISTLSFLPTIQTACVENGIQEEAAKWIFQYFVRKKKKAALSARLIIKVERRKSMDYQFTSYIEVVN